MPNILKQAPGKPGRHIFGQTPPNLFDTQTTGFRTFNRELVNRLNHTSRVVVVTPTDRPKSVRNRCAIEVFGGVFV